MPLSTTDIAALSRLLDEALELDASQREAWLSKLPASEQHLAPKLREMLAARDNTGTSGFLAALPVLDDTGSPDEETARAGESVGPYRLIREIGRGGMGTVWLAERADGAFKRQLALKLPRLAWGAGLAKRMARERDIGAMLEHPNIARLYDAGVDERGRPFIALEYIDGIAIDAWCQQHKLPMYDRLQLIVQVAKAVTYAHGRLVVHRDLKPSNVLVSADGQVHLLDFGIAKLLDDAQQERAATQEQVRVLTPHYASPEQLKGETLTVQSDVYSLGVLAYELLTGAMPYDARRKTPAAIEEAILQGEVIAPSQRVEDSALARQLKGDVDAIVGKAMKVEQGQRYPTADALAADIERYLAGETVTARPDSRGYRLRKMFKRHWIGVSASAAVLVSVLTGAGIAVVQAQRAANAAEKERLVREFVADVFRVNVEEPAAPGELRSAPADAFLERGAKLVRARFDGQPAMQAELYAIVGRSFEDMGAYRLAASYGTQRLAAMSLAGIDRAELAQAHLNLARILLNDRQLDAAESQALRAVELGSDRRQIDLGANLVVIEVKQIRGQHDEADRLLNSVEDRIAAADDDGLIAARAMQARAFSLSARNRRPESVQVREAAIARATAAEGPGSIAAAEIHLDQAWELASTEQDAAKADEHFRVGYEVIRAQGHEHAIRAASRLARFASYRYRAGHQTSFEATVADIARARSAVAASGRALPSEVVSELEWNEGAVLSHFGNVAAAAPLLNKSVPTLYRDAWGWNRRFHLSTAYANQLQHSGQHAEADWWFRERFKARVEGGGSAHPWAAFDYYMIADNLRMMQRLAEATAFLDKAPTFPHITLEYGHPDRYNLHLKLLRSLITLDGGGPVRALAAFPQDLLEPLDRGEPSWSDTEARFVYGRLLCANGRAREGVEAIGVVLRRQEAKRYEHAPEMAYRRAVAGLCALQIGDRRNAQAWAQQARESFTVQPGVSDFYKAPLLELEAKLAKR